jgi:hypothetical protein
MKFGITGHQRIPLIAIEYLRQALVDFLRSECSELIGVSSLAAGADQLFASVLLELGGKLVVIIPCEKYEETFKTIEDITLYESLLAHSSTITRLAFAEPSAEAFLAAGRGVVNASDLLIAMWDGMPSRGLGGTADIVEYARVLRKEVRVMWPPLVNRDVSPLE